MTSIEYFPPISKAEFDSLGTEENSVKEQKRIIDLIDKRLGYVYPYLCSLTGNKLEWFDFDNAPESHNGDPERGEFNYKLYSENIRLIRSVEPFMYKGQSLSLYDDSIPAKFMYEEIDENEIKKLIQDEKDSIDKKIQEKNAKKVAVKTHRESLIASIKSKLTKEELGIIEFKKFKQ